MQALGVVVWFLGTAGRAGRYRAPPRKGRIMLMDREHIKGAADKAKGTIKEGAGKLTGDESMEAEGKMDKAAGKVQNAAGGVKDALKGKR